MFGFSFYCGNCDGESFESPEKVYEHWTHKHVGEKVEPFTFRVSNFACCFYCGYSGGYGALCAHNCKERGTKPIVFTDVRDETQCALCSFKGDNMVAHAMAEHAVVSELKIPNPIAINEACLKELLEFDLHKKVSCLHLQRIYYDFNRSYQIQILFHFSKKKTDQMWLLQERIRNRTSIRSA